MNTYVLNWPLIYFSCNSNMHVIKTNMLQLNLFLNMTSFVNSLKFKNWICALTWWLVSERAELFNDKYLKYRSICHLPDISVWPICSISLWRIKTISNLWIGAGSLMQRWHICLCSVKHSKWTADCVGCYNKETAPIKRDYFTCILILWCGFTTKHW